MANFNSSDVENNKGLTVLMAAIPFLFFLVYCVEPMKKSDYSKHTANSSLIIFIVGVISAMVAGIVGKILGLIPIVGFALSVVIDVALGLCILFLIVLNVLDALNATGKELPIIGVVKLIK